MARSIYTIGHSTRTRDQFQNLLSRNQIELLIDVRTMPRSRHVPHFNSGDLKKALEPTKIEYLHFKSLGGLRKPNKDSINTGWRNAGFRGFADYMQTEEFQRGVAEVLSWASERRLALMCAEAVPWRCHRSLIADVLVVRQCQVWHIISESGLQSHELTPFAVIEGERIIYPAKEQRQIQKKSKKPEIQ